MSEDMKRLEDNLRSEWDGLVRLAGMLEKDPDTASEMIELNFLELSPAAATLSIGGPNIWLEWLPHTDADACLYGVWGESKRVLLSELSELPASETQDVISALYHAIGPGYFREIGAIPDDNYVIHN